MPGPPKAPFLALFYYLSLTPPLLRGCSCQSTHLAEHLSQATTCVDGIYLHAEEGTSCFIS